NEPFAEELAQLPGHRGLAGSGQTAFVVGAPHQELESRQPRRVTVGGGARSCLAVGDDPFELQRHGVSPTPTITVSSRIGAVPRLRQAWLVPRCTTTSPAGTSTTPSSSTSSTGPSSTMT